MNDTDINATKGVIRVGVTGHRTLRYYPTLVKTVRRVLQQIEKKGSYRNNLKQRLMGISPLAEGADRLVAKEILKRAGVLIAPIPFPTDEYLTDFTTSQSRVDFKNLLAQAQSTLVMPSVQDRMDAYEAVGRYVVDNCDVLIALWDGGHSTGRGGTADIVDYARKHRKPLYWVHTHQPEKITTWNLDAINQRS